MMEEIELHHGGAFGPGTRDRRWVTRTCESAARGEQAGGDKTAAGEAVGGCIDKRKAREGRN